MIQTRFILPVGALVLGLAIGLAGGWKLYRPKAAPVETAAPAVRQTDQSLILERKPEAKPQPMHELPKGAKLERQVQVTVMPSIPMDGQRIPGSGNLPEIPDSSTRPVTVDLSLVKMEDGTRRVVASAEGGTIVAGIDIPVQGPMPTEKPLRWSGAVLRGYDAYRHQGVWGASISYARGPFVATGGVIGETAFVGAGIRF